MPPNVEALSFSELRKWAPKATAGIDALQAKARCEDDCMIVLRLDADMIKEINCAWAPLVTKAAQLNGVRSRPALAEKPASVANGAESPSCLIASLPAALQKSLGEALSKTVQKLGEENATAIKDLTTRFDEAHEQIHGRFDHTDHQMEARFDRTDGLVQVTNRNVLAAHVDISAAYAAAEQRAIETAQADEERRQRESEAQRREFERDEAQRLQEEEREEERRRQQDEARRQKMEEERKERQRRFAEQHFQDEVRRSNKLNEMQTQQLIGIAKANGEGVQTVAAHLDGKMDRVMDVAAHSLEAAVLSAEAADGAREEAKKAREVSEKGLAATGKVQQSVVGLGETLQPICRIFNELTTTDFAAKVNTDVAEEIAKGKGDAAYVNSLDTDKWWLKAPARPSKTQSTAAETQPRRGRSSAAPPRAAAAPRRPRWVRACAVACAVAGVAPRVHSHRTHRSPHALPCPDSPGRGLSRARTSHVRERVSVYIYPR